MDAVRANEIHKKLQAVMDEFAKANGLTVSPIRGNFTSTDIKISLVLGDAQAIGADTVNPEYVRNLERNGGLYGLDRSFLGKKFNFGQRIGVTFQGLKGKKAVFRTADGEVRLADATLVAQILKVTK